MCVDLKPHGQMANDKLSSLYFQGADMVIDHERNEYLLILCPLQPRRTLLQYGNFMKEDGAAFQQLKL